LLIRVPVSDAISCFIFGMSIGSFVGLGHALHRWLSRLIMSDHDERFNGCQAPRRDSCTNALKTVVSNPRFADPPHAENGRFDSRRSDHVPRPLLQSTCH
jgi:hypothetical protein